MNILTNNGWVMADVAVTMLALIAAILAMARLAGPPNTLRRAGAWLASAGWLILFARLAHELIEGGDPHISTIGQVSLGLMGAGMILYMMGDR